MSVGHIARMLEEAGVPTVIVAVRAFLPTLAKMTVPRAVITRNLMGKPLGAPGDAARQREVLLAALNLLETAREAGTFLELPEIYRLPARLEE